MWPDVSSTSFLCWMRPIHWSECSLKVPGWYFLMTSFIFFAHFLCCNNMFEYLGVFSQYS